MRASEDYTFHDAVSESLKSFLRTLPALPPRSFADHKGTYGKCAIVGGSYGMGGAMILSGSAALAAGAGLVQLLIPETVLPVVAGLRPEYMTSPLPADSKGRIALEARNSIGKISASAKSVAMGPGMGRSLGLDVLVSGFYETVPQPAIFDADALNALAAREAFIQSEDREIFVNVVPSCPRGARILTPHPGEFKRISGISVSSDPRIRRDAAVQFARCARSLAGSTSFQFVLVLKGAGTVVTDGDRVFINETGNPGMGTGGSGDVLTGVLAAFCALGQSPFDAAVLAVALHGLAGDLAARELGMESVTAGSLVEYLPRALVLFRKYRDSESTGILDGTDA